MILLFINHLNNDLFNETLPAQTHTIDNISMHNSIESRINERVAELERSLDNFLRYYPDTIFIDDLSEKINNAKQLL